MSIAAAILLIFPQAFGMSCPQTACYVVDFVIAECKHTSEVHAPMQARKTPGLANCSYSNDGAESRSEDPVFSEMPKFEDMSEASISHWAENLIEEVGAAIEATFQDSGLFTKRYDNYHDEAEFRFAWTLAEPASGTFLVNCPNAIRYCSRR